MGTVQSQESQCYMEISLAVPALPDPCVLKVEEISRINEDIENWSVPLMLGVRI